MTEGQAVPRGSWISFKLPDKFVSEYSQVKPNWGFDIGGGNSLGELVYISKYSRKKDEAIGYPEGHSEYGKKERWFETCRRCIEGSYSILKDYCRTNRTPWNEAKAQKSAQDAFDRMFNFKWLPPGRGLANMGTGMVHEDHNSATLQNCAYVSTDKLSSRSIKEATLPFERIFEMSMNGVGVGFDVRGAGKLTIHQPTGEPVVHVIEDTRESWAQSLTILLETYFFHNRSPVEFDYSKIRKKGAPLKRFGGTASGPEPLQFLHDQIRELLSDRQDDLITATDIADIGNLAGFCAVSGGARRSAEILLGDPTEEFIGLKNGKVNPRRNGLTKWSEDGMHEYHEDGGWGHLSNNSIFAETGGDYSHLVDSIATNGEPGLIYLDLIRGYGRLEDPRNDIDHKVAGTNPCAEQSLESNEMCCLVETFPFHHEDYNDYRETLKAAYLYGKSVTLIPTIWPESNEIMQRNRRIGTSMSGVAQFVESRGVNELKDWSNRGYDFVCHRDSIYSEWLGVRESIKKTSIKPSGTVSLLCGATPGKHWPEFTVYFRRMRFMKLDPMLDLFKEAGYHVEPDVMDPNSTAVVTFPAKGPDVRSQTEVSVWEKVHMAAILQRYWADNQVSATFTFRQDEKDQIGPIISCFDGQLKSMSFLPTLEGGSYPQMPYEAITMDEWESKVAGIDKVNFDSIYDDVDSKEAEGEKFCSNDTCTI